MDEKETKKDISENPPVEEKEKKKSKLKYILNISIVLIITIAALIVSLWGNLDEVLSLLKKSNWLLILGICGLFFFCVCIRGLILYLFARLYTKKYKFHQGLANDQIGVFYNAVTPGSSGGQFMQAYTFKKQGVPISSAVSIMAMYSIIFQSVLSIYGLLAFFVKFDAINQIDAIKFVIIQGKFEIALPMWVLTIIGFLLNVSVILIVFLMAYWKGFHRFIMGPCISFLAKLKILRNPDKSRESLRVQVENFKMEFRRLTTNIPFTILVTVLFVCYFTIKFSIPFFVGKAMNPNAVTGSFWDSVFLSNYHQMVTGLIPIPGSAGVSEFFFTELFSKSGFFKVIGTDGLLLEKETKAFCRAALLLWRSITFTFPLVIAGFVSAFYKGTPKEIVGRTGVPSRQTFVDLQSETFAVRKNEFDTFLETKQISASLINEKIKSLTKKKKKNKNGSVIKQIDDGESSISLNDLNEKTINSKEKRKKENKPNKKDAKASFNNRNKKIDSVSIDEDDDSL